MKKAIIKKDFIIIQWFGRDYPYYEQEEEENTFEIGDEVLVLHEVESNNIGRLFVVYSSKINQSTVVAESYLEFIN